MTCSICGTIGDVERANTGRDVHFTAPITSLKRNGFGGRDDLWECPECEAVFHWYDDTAQSGSGNNDEEILTRLSSDHASLVRGFLRRGERPVLEVAKSAAELHGLPDAARDMILSHVVSRDRELAACLVPWFLDEIGRKERRWMAAFLGNFVSYVDAKLVASELELRPETAALQALRAQCKRVLCTICRDAVPAHSSAVAHRRAPKPPLDRLVQLRATDELDAWECPECDSMFAWTKTEGEEGRLSRMLDFAADALRACVHRQGVVSANDREMVFASDRHRSLTIALGHGLRSDRELVRQFIPRMIAELSRAYGSGPSWMQDFLCAFVEGHRDDAEAVLAVISSAPSKNALLEAVAAHCRGVME